MGQGKQMGQGNERHDELLGQAYVGHFLDLPDRAVSFDPVESKPLAAIAIAVLPPLEMTRSQGAVRP
jgi:hypothetical protein